MLNDYSRNRALDELLREEEKRRRMVHSTNIDMESSFSPNTKIGGIMEPTRPKFESIQLIKDAQAKQTKRLEDLRKKQWNDLATGTDEIQIINTQNVENAKKGLVDLDFELTAAYGLDPNGYLSKAKELDNEVMSYEPKTSSQNTVLPQTTTDYSAPKSHYEADDWVMHGKQPQQVPKQKPITTVQPQNPSGTKPISYYDLGEDEKQKLQADENVLAWQQSQPQIPTDEMYDAQIGYYNNMVAKAQDDYVNAFGQSSEADASEKDWSDYSDKVDGLVAQRDAYNRAKMGMDEGDTNSGDNEFVHGTQYFGSGDNEKPVPDIVQNHPHQEGDESLGIFNEGAFSGGGSGAGGSWGEGDEKLSLEDIQRINQVTSLSRSFLSTTDNKGAAESEAIMIDFTTPEFEQAIEMYSYLKDGKSIGEDLAAQIVEGYPKIAEKWGYDRLVVEINLHYMLYQMGYETDRTKICNISNEKDTSWEIVEKLTEFQKFSDNLQLPK